jgi:hypothetical protein
MFMLFMISPVITSVLNDDARRIGPFELPGVGVYDAGSAILSAFIQLLPFMLARQFLRSSQDIADLLRILAAAGALYSLPVLFELRMSPQLSIWIYGIGPTEWFQNVRDGGFRPIVFLGHGLVVSFFLMTTVIAAAAMWRIRIRPLRAPAAALTGYLAVVLLLCKSLGAFVYGAVLAPLVRFASPRMQMRAAVLLVAFALTYPMLRTMDLVPTATLLEAAHSVSEERAESLQLRFDQEKMLLDHAWERPLFGWGRYGRSRVYDAETGRDITVTDGLWIITLGTFGLVGFVLQFGLLTLPVFRAVSAVKVAASMEDQVCLAALALILAVNVVDLVPNSTLSPLTWLFAGALVGRCEALYAAGQQRGSTWESKPGVATN